MTGAAAARLPIAVGIVLIHSQDLWVINEIFGKALARGYKGFFIEAGASDGVYGSNTLLLERKYGWDGLLIEPNLFFFQKLKKKRKVICRRCLLSNKEEKMDFIEAGYFGAALDHVKEIFDSKGMDLREHSMYQKNQIAMKI